jgi:hypothetical protein
MDCSYISSIYHHQEISRICLAIGLQGWIRKRGHKSELALVLFLRRYGIYAMIIFLIERNKKIYAGYPSSHILDPYVVLPTTNEQAAGNGFWMQPAGIGRTGFIQSVRLVF